MTELVQLVTRTAQLRVSWIHYIAASERSIAMGVMADIVVGGWYGLGLMARSEIGADELNGVGAFVRPIVSKPFDSLIREFDRVWLSEDPLKVFAELPRIHKTSLRFEELRIKSLEVPKPLLSSAHADDGSLKLWVADSLHTHLSDFWWERVDAPSRQERREEKKLAA